jgi:hypothetical protein
MSHTNDRRVTRPLSRVVLALWTSVRSLFCLPKFHTTPETHTPPDAQTCPGTGEVVRKQNFLDYTNRVHELLRTHPASSTVVSGALHSLRTYSSIPPVEIVERGVWATPTDQLIVRTHIRCELSDAVSNIQKAGIDLSLDDLKYLGLILTHWCGWAPTPPNHIDGSWIRYLQAEYSHLHPLVPILDTLVWPEELQNYPNGRFPRTPWLFLLASSESFYVYDFQNCYLCCAGTRSLEKLYVGLKEQRFRMMNEGDWIEAIGCLDETPADYIPVYTPQRNSVGEFILERPVKEFREDI